MKTNTNDHTEPDDSSSNETMLERMAREKKEDALARKQKYDEVRARLKRFLRRIALSFRLFFFDRIVQKASRTKEEQSRAQEHKKELAANVEADARANEIRKTRRRAWAVFFVALATASADILFVLPNIGFALASRFAGGEEPTSWEKFCAFGVLEVSILVLLLTMKSLSETRVHAQKRDNARSPSEYYAARNRLWGARFARTAYVVLITFAFALNISAEIGKQDSAQNMWRTLRESMATDGGRSAEGAPVLLSGTEGPEDTVASVPITAGVSVLIWALHIAVLFLRSGEFGRRSCSELTKAELEHLDRKLTLSLNALLLRINSKLQSAAENEQKYSVMVNRIPEAVRTELYRLMGKRPAPIADPAENVADSNSLFVFRPNRRPRQDGDAEAGTVSA